MDTKHTPGPWAAEGWLIVRDLKTRRLRYAVGSAETAADISEEAQTANAHLMAAAPDLLEALEDMLEEYEDICQCGKAKSCYRCNLIKQSRAASEAA